MGIKEKAARNFAEKGYNCCQAVICAYCEEYGIADDDIFKVTEGFGAGMGGLLNTCGAVTGMYMSIGMHNSAGEKDNPRKTKMDTYASIRDVAEKFEEENGSIFCRDLKSVENGVQRVSCQKCVEDAAELVEKYIAEHK